MKLVLGPMEGVLDALMRQMLTEINGYDLCVTEFVRIVDALLPPRVYHRMCPELEAGGKTTSGTPVRVQLLGQSPQYMAENAAQVIELGSAGVDINFGCPSKTVNGSKGGAALLKDPEQLFQVVKAVRNAVPVGNIVSAKVRLGFDDCSSYREIVDAVQLAGADEIVVHGRSKADAYKPGTVRWDLIGDITQRLRIPVTANGDIWNQEDALRCQAVTGCDTLMVCRGALNVPNLGAHIKRGEAMMSWHAVLALLVRYSEFEIRGDKGLYYANRVKQWFRYLQVQYPQSNVLFAEIRQLKDKQQILNIIVAALNDVEKRIERYGEAEAFA
ncbi:tRNA dihydrouridine(16) synthase DusC [Enterovibrio calviensis]|uniref:tRNA dihydrouridine(16) synthase DusC n=1 Tax=Enterovibrio calviensis TaxID=91359 RepID=UPI000489756C|nr:tRNA dihydrouridine(16) synthase DusC [Enterovibrio calviensis]